MLRPILIVASYIVIVNSYRLIHMKNINNTAIDKNPIPSTYEPNDRANIARKNFNNQSARKMEHQPQKAEKKAISQRRYNKKGDKQNESEDNSLERVVLSLNSGLKKILQQNNIQPNFLDAYAQQVIDFFKNSAGPMFRAAEAKYSIKPEIVHFRSEKPTVKFEVNAKTMVALLKDILKSRAFNENLDHIVKQAGIIFRTIQNGDIDKNM